MPRSRSRSAAARTILAVMAALICLLACPYGTAAASHKMFRKQTEHYLVETDISPRFTAVVGRHMEAIFREYSRRLEGFGQMHVPFKVMVFGKEEDYLKAVPASVRGSTGVFIARDLVLAAHADGRTAEEVLRTLYHEGFHQFMYCLISRDCPTWLNEGLAEYFSEATWNGQGFTTGLVPTMRLHIVQQAIRDGTYIPLVVLFNMDPGQWLQNVRTDAHRADLHYSEAWSVVQFLLHADGGRYADRLKLFLKELSEREDEKDAFQKSFGTNIAAFEGAWASYMMSLKPSPKFVCADNMEAIMQLAKLVYDDPNEFRSVAQLRYDLLYRNRKGWEIVWPDGKRVSYQQPERVAELFHCPFDTEQSGISYMLIRYRGVPVLVCNHHPGIIVEAYYDVDPSGRLKVRVEEVVRAVAPQEVLEAIAAASRRRQR